MTPGGCCVGALVGPGRSGTTWVGTLIDSCPDVVYRFEPFHRLAPIDTEYRRWMQKLKQQEVRQEDLAQLYRLLYRAHPLTDKEPFFPKSYPLFTFGRRQLWPIARMLRPAAQVYDAAYSPPLGAPVVFKEVTFIRQLQNLIERTDMAVIYLVRHPCATVLSEVHGQQEGKMPSARQQRLKEVLLEHSPDLAERFAEVCEGTDMIRKTALLWRCEMEACVRRVMSSRRGMIITYEQLADDAYTHVKVMFAHLGLTYSGQTAEFIDALYGLRSPSQHIPKRTGWGDSYYSIYRNPREQKDAWKVRISTEDRCKIEAIVADSAAVAHCAALGAWS